MVMCKIFIVGETVVRTSVTCTCFHFAVRYLLRPQSIVLNYFQGVPVFFALALIFGPGIIACITALIMYFTPGKKSLSFHGQNWLFALADIIFDAVAGVTITFYKATPLQ